MGKLGRFFRDVCTPILVLLLGGVVVHDHLAALKPEAAAPVVNGKALGKRFTQPLATSFGDAWLVAADALEQGKTVAEAQSALQTSWQGGRAQAFTTLVTPGFAKVLTEGTEPTTPSQRAEVVKLWRDFAAGLKGGR